MGRKRRLYKEHLTVWKAKRQGSHVIVSPPSPVPEPPARTIERTLLSSTTTIVCTAAPVFASLESRRKRLKYLKTTLLRVVALNTGLSLLAAVTGCLALLLDQDEEAQLKGTVVTCVLLLLSALQTALVVYYWDVSVKYSQILRRSMVVDGEYKGKLIESPKEFMNCLIECCFHLIMPLPSVKMIFHYTIFGKASNLSLNVVLYLAVLARNCHIVRLLYWSSRLSDCRSHIFAHLVRVNSYKGFCFRSYLAMFSVKFVAVIIGVTIVISGVFKYVVDPEAFDSSQVHLWNDFWVVAYTQLTIGYGERAPGTFLSQVLVVVSCLVGIFMLGLFNAISSGTLMLSLTECNLYSELLYSKHKRAYSSTATILIQRWWRLMFKRKYRLIRAGTIVSFYSYLLTYRRILVRCHRVKDTRFERQIEAFEKSTHKAIYHLNEYLRPVSFAYTTVCPT